jgi:hypothetical protein
MPKSKCSCRAWAAVDEDDQPVAYLIAEPVDGNWPVEHVSVQVGHVRRGIGRTLPESVAHSVIAAGRPSLTLTTVSDVP